MVKVSKEEIRHYQLLALPMQCYVGTGNTKVIHASFNLFLKINYRSRLQTIHMYLNQVLTNAQSCLPFRFCCLCVDFILLGPKRGECFLITLLL